MAETVQVQDVQYYSSKEHELKQTQIHKAQLFVDHNCIGYDPLTKRFYCKPLQGYNSTQYWFEKCKENPWGFSCDCQGFQTKVKKEGIDKASCSHCLALHYMLDRVNRENKWGRYREEKTS